MTDEHTQEVMYNAPYGMATTVFEDLLYYRGGPAIRQEIETYGALVTSVPYVPTDWNYTQSEKTFWDGLDPADGTCSVCFMHRSRNGACSIDCPGEQLKPVQP